MNLSPDRIFADRPFGHAESTGRWVSKLTMHPNALYDLERRLRSAGMLRETGFSRRRTRSGSVARYRGVDVTTDRNLDCRFQAHYSDGTVETIPLDRHSRS